MCTALMVDTKLGVKLLVNSHYVLGSLSNPRLLQGFIDYLKSLKINAYLKEDGSEYCVYITDESQCEQAQKEWQRFIQQPHSKRYMDASWENHDSNIRFNYSSSYQEIMHSISHQAGGFTKLIMAISLCIFGFYSIGLRDVIYPSFYFFQSLSMESLWEGWRWLTPSLLHFSLLHLLFNLLWWWYLGGRIELVLGIQKIMGLFLGTSVVANTIQFLWTGPMFGGLSGVVYGLMGYLWILNYYRPIKSLELPPMYIGFMLIWLALGFTDIFGLHMANGAHLGGLILGMLFGLIDGKKERLDVRY